MIQLPLFAQESRKGEVGVGGSGVCDLLEDAGDDTQGTRNPPVLGEVAEGRE